jgi:hypothetical protein
MARGWPSPQTTPPSHSVQPNGTPAARTWHPPSKATHRRCSHSRSSTETPHSKTIPGSTEATAPLPTEGHVDRDLARTIQPDHVVEVTLLRRHGCGLTKVFSARIIAVRRMRHLYPLKHWQSWWLRLLGQNRLLRPGTPAEVRLTTSAVCRAAGSLPRGAPERFRLPSGLLEEIWPLLLTHDEYGSRHWQSPAQ